MTGRNAHELLARNEPVDTGEGDSGDDDGELGNVHECTHLDISYLPTWLLGNLILYS